jgi:hypothetical protein
MILHSRQSAACSLGRTYCQQSTRVHLTAAVTIATFHDFLFNEPVQMFTKEDLEGVPNGLLDFPDALGTLSKDFLLFLRQWQDGNTLHSIARETARNGKEHVVFHAVEATDTGGNGTDASGVV